MKFLPTKLQGAFIVEAEPLADERGFFARLYCRHEFQRQGLDIDIVQSSVSHNAAAGTLRGMHFQWPPSDEAKLVRCERGSIFDVIVDLRPSSASFMQHMALELASSSHTALYVPAGFAHGFQTLEADTDVVYMMSDYYQPQLSGGARFDDPAFAIDWPLPVSVIAARDLDYADFDELAYVNDLAQCRASGGQKQ